MILFAAVSAILAPTGVAAPASPVPTRPGAAEIRYLQNSGWLVVTANHALVFDPVTSIPGIEPLPREATPDVEAYRDRRLVVFVTHGHGDHYDPSVLEWRGRHPDLQYVVGMPLSGEGLAVQHMKPRAEWSSRGLQVATTGSTDQGVGFLVTVDGITILHAGDHAAWTDAAMGAFVEEIQWLAARRPSIDIAFFPIATGSACDPRPSIWKGVVDATKTLEPRVLFPMHVRCVGQLPLHERFRAAHAADMKKTQVVAATARGDRFHYRDGKVLPGRMPGATVLFVCEHGSVKSLLAKRLFEKAAADAGLDVAAESRGTVPDDAVPAWMVKALETDGLGIGDWRPSAVGEAHLRAAARVIAFDVEVPVAAAAGVTVERWDGVPPVSKDYAAGRAAIEARVDALVAEMKRARKDASPRP